MRRRAMVGILAVVALVATGCTPSLRWESPTAGPSAAGSASSGGPSAGSVRWTRCTDTARQILPRLASDVEYDCGSVVVPQDWNHKNDGKTFEIALMRVRSAQQHRRIGSLITNPGGPGGSGVELAAYLSLELPSDVLDRFDIVGFDPRGVGHSTPALKCFSDSDLDASFAADPDPGADPSAAVDRTAAATVATVGDRLRTCPYGQR